MNPITAWQKVVIQNYANFGGRARRSEYWHFVLANLIVSVVLSFVLGGFSENLLSNLYSLAVLVPSIAVAVRRLHDVGRNGWWLLLAFTCVGVIPLLVWACTDSQRGSNEWGVSEKYPA